MSFPHSNMPTMGLNTDFLGISGEDSTMLMSPSLSLLDYDDANFSAIGDSMFPIRMDTQHSTQDMGAYGTMYTAQPKLNLDTNMHAPQVSMGMSHQADAAGDLFYSIQNAPDHRRHSSVTSPNIMLDEQLLLDATTGRYPERDFIKGGTNRIYLQASEELTQTGMDVKLLNMVGHGYNVQHPFVRGLNMDGIHAMHIGIATLCQGSGRIPPSELLLLNFLQQQLARVRDGTAPQVNDAGIDRPLLLEHLLMISHQYGLRNNEHVNIGVIRPSFSGPLPFGAAATYTVSLAGPKTQGSRTIWLYEEAGRWFPLARNDFSVTTKSYAEALKMPVAPPSTQRPVTPASSNLGLLHPGFSPSSQNTAAPSEAGTDMTSNTGLSCRSCGRKCSSQSGLAHHHRNHRPRSLSCTYTNCSRTFLYGKDLRRHEKTHSSKDTRMDYRCPMPGCAKAYTRQDNLRRHQKLDHPGLFPPVSEAGSSRRSDSSKHG